MKKNNLIGVLTIGILVVGIEAVLLAAPPPTSNETDSSISLSKDEDVSDTDTKSSEVDKDIVIFGSKDITLTKNDSCTFDILVDDSIDKIVLKSDTTDDLFTYTLDMGETTKMYTLKIIGGTETGSCKIWLEGNTGVVSDIINFKNEKVIEQPKPKESSKQESSSKEESKQESSKEESSKEESKQESKTEDSEVKESNVEDIKYSEPIVFSGFGDKVITDIKVPNKMYKVELRHNGDSNFITHVYTKSGKRLSSLSNEIGTYIGEIVLTDDIDGGTLEVKADGEWYITFMDVEYGGTSKVSGKGDRVTKYFSLGTGVNVVNMRHNGDSNFIVHIYDNTGRRYSSLANEIGNYIGSVVFNEAEYGKKYCLEVTADGNWNIDFSKDGEVTYYN